MRAQKLTILTLHMGNLTEKLNDEESLVGINYQFCNKESLRREVARLERLEAEGTSYVHIHRKVRYYGSILRAWPDWGIPDEEYKALYRHKCKLVDHHMDHIVPLSSPLVCGLHVPWNLQPEPRLVNMKKSNKWWPDAPFEQHDIGLEEISWHQLSLALQ